nr:hypothetical protein [Tanacetum cinerariifolium]
MVNKLSGYTIWVLMKRHNIDGDEYWPGELLDLVGKRIRWKKRLKPTNGGGSGLNHVINMETPNSGNEGSGSGSGGSSVNKRVFIDLDDIDSEEDEATNHEFEQLFDDQAKDDSDDVDAIEDDANDDYDYSDSFIDDGTNEDDSTDDDNDSTPFQDVTPVGSLAFKSTIVNGTYIYKTIGETETKGKFIFQKHASRFMNQTPVNFNIDVQKLKGKMLTRQSAWRINLTEYVHKVDKKIKNINLLEFQKKVCKEQLMHASTPIRCVVVEVSNQRLELTATYSISTISE